MCTVCSSIYGPFATVNNAHTKCYCGNHSYSTSSFNTADGLICNACPDGSDSSSASDLRGSPTNCTCKSNYVAKVSSKGVTSSCDCPSATYFTYPTTAGSSYLETCRLKTSNVCFEGLYCPDSSCTVITKCKQCSDGLISGNAQYSCTNCTTMYGVNTVANNDNTKCYCADHYYGSSEFNTASGLTCTACPAGSDSNSTDIEGADTTCTCNENFIPNTNNDGIVTKCTCPKGYYTSGSWYSKTCTLCPAGYWCDGTDIKQSCPEGTYSNSTGQYSNSTCSVCPMGYYCTGGKNLTPCSPGTYGSSTGRSTACPVCPDVHSDSPSGASSCVCNENYDNKGTWGSALKCTCPSDYFLIGRDWDYNQTCNACPDNSGSLSGNTTCLCDSNYYSSTGTISWAKAELFSYDYSPPGNDPITILADTSSTTVCEFCASEDSPYPGSWYSRNGVIRNFGSLSIDSGFGLELESSKFIHSWDKGGDKSKITGFSFEAWVKYQSFDNCMGWSRRFGAFPLSFASHDEVTGLNATERNLTWAFGPDNAGHLSFGYITDVAGGDNGGWGPNANSTIAYVTSNRLPVDTWVHVAFQVDYGSHTFFKAGDGRHTFNESNLYMYINGIVDKKITLLIDGIVEPAFNETLSFMNETKLWSTYKKTHYTSNNDDNDDWLNQRNTFRPRNVGSYLTIGSYLMDKGPIFQVADVRMTSNKFAYPLAGFTPPLVPPDTSTSAAGNNTKYNLMLETNPLYCKACGGGSSSTNKIGSTSCTCPTGAAWNSADNTCICKADYYSVDGTGGIDGMQCKACIYGTTQATTGMTMCQCKANYYSNTNTGTTINGTNGALTGGTACRACPPGATSAIGSSSCTCPTHSLWDAISNKCLCDANYYSKDGSGTSGADGKQCVKCGQSSVSTRGSSSCNCTADYTRTQFNTTSNTCDCRAGYFSSYFNNGTGGANGLSCSECYLNSYSYAGSEVCLCDIGYTSWNGHAINDSSCSRCDTGSPVNLTTVAYGQMDCACPANYYSKNALKDGTANSTTDCVACPSKYFSYPGSITCYPIPTAAPTARPTAPSPVPTYSPTFAPVFGSYNMLKLKVTQALYGVTSAQLLSTSTFATLAAKEQVQKSNFKFISKTVKSLQNERNHRGLDDAASSVTSAFAVAFANVIKAILLASNIPVDTVTVTQIVDTNGAGVSIAYTINIIQSSSSTTSSSSVLKSSTDSILTTASSSGALAAALSADPSLSSSAIAALSTAIITSPSITMSVVVITPEPTYTPTAKPTIIIQNTSVIGYIVGGVVLLIIIVVAVLVYGRMRKKKNVSSGTGEAEPLEEGKGEGGEGGEYFGEEEEEGGDFQDGEETKEKKKKKKKKKKTKKNNMSSEEEEIVDSSASLQVHTGGWHLGDPLGTVASVFTFGFYQPLPTPPHPSHHPEHAELPDHPEHHPPHPAEAHDQVHQRQR